MIIGWVSYKLGVPKCAGLLQMPMSLPWAKVMAISQSRSMGKAARLSNKRRKRLSAPLGVPSNKSCAFNTRTHTTVHASGLLQRLHRRQRARHATNCTQVPLDQDQALVLRPVQAYTHTRIPTQTMYPHPDSPDNP